MAQWLGTLATLPEDPDSVPSTHMVLTAFYNISDSEDAATFSGLQGHQACM